MKAIRIREFGPPEVMKIEEAADPRPGQGQVAVEVKAAGVNPVEAYVRSGSYARKPDLPHTPGTDGAGVVKETGPGVKAFRPGDRVYLSGSLSGTYAATALCLEDQVHRLPAKVSFAQGAALGVPYATAWRALFQKAAAKKGETAFIHGGSGGVGVAAIQIALAAGLRVIATAGTVKGMKLVESQGATALDHGASDYIDRLRALTGDRGPDVILEMLANVNLAKDLAVIGPRGRIVIIGSRGKTEIDPRLVMGHDVLVTGFVLFNATSEELREIHAGLAKGLIAGSLQPAIAREFPLAEAPAAHEAVMAGGHYGKIVLVP
jgi:NADPH2:quinone reductase